MEAEQINALKAFATWTSSTENDKWSQLAQDRARDAYIDTLAVMVPGAKEEVTKKVYKMALKWGKGNCHAIGFSEGLSSPMAALVNGTAAHALDFDDNFDPAKAHASAVLVPALLAVAEERNYSGMQLIDAYIVGLQIMGRVGQGVNPFHRNRGWHATATVGTVGAAAGCARLLGLTVEQTAHAISLSTSLAGGFMSQFGTMAKPLHAGLAAAGAVQAAQFAEEGITAGTETLDGEHGMGTLMVGQDVEELREIMKDRDEHGQKVVFAVKDIGLPLLIERYGLKVKLFPNCASQHRSIDGFMSLREKHAFKMEDVEQVLVRAPSSHLKNLMYLHPQNSMEAKFSLEYGLAVSMLGGMPGLPDYEEEAVHREQLKPLYTKVKREYVDKMESEFPTEVIVRLTSGDEVQTAVPMPRGSAKLPLTVEQLREKFALCVKGLLTEDALEKIWDVLMRLQTDAKSQELMSAFQA